MEELEEGSKLLNSLRFKKVLKVFTEDDVNEYLAKKFIMMHHENHILVCTYQETILSLDREEIEKNTEVPITDANPKKLINN